MRYSFLLATALLLAANPALALRVTNLDTQPHRIAFEAAGHTIEREIAPNATVRLDGLPSGRLSLVTSPNPRTGGALNADGVLSGYIGNGRDQRIPAEMMDDYVIWPGGELRLQRRMKQYGNGR
jgi:hypothetical protein